MGNKNGVPVLRDQDVVALSKSSGLDEVQVKEAFNAFLVEHPKGKMKPKDFSEMMTKVRVGVVLIIFIIVILAIIFIIVFGITVFIIFSAGHAQEGC